MSRPFEVDGEYLVDHLDELVDVTFSDLQSDFLVLPKGGSFVEYRDFQHAYEVLKRHTTAFSNFTEPTVWAALRDDSLTLVVLRVILGMTPPEWSDLVRSEIGILVPQGFARSLDASCRSNRGYLAGLDRPRRALALDRIEALVSVAIQYIQRGAPPDADGVVHRLSKADTEQGLESLQYVAAFDIPYAMLLYERFLGRPFASHRDAISELVGEIMERAVEDKLRAAGISFRKTMRAERVPGFDQSPDFFIPDEFNPSVLIEAKITGDDGTARDKITRIIHLAEIRDERVRRGLPGFEVVACIDGRGFGVRRQDMRRMLIKTGGKVFTLATLGQLVSKTQLSYFVTKDECSG